MSVAYIVCVLKDGRRCWFREEERRIVNHVPVYFPIFDDEVSKPVTLEFAFDARKRWRDNFGIDCHIALDRYGAFVGEESIASIPRDDRYVQHESRFVPLTGGGVDDLGYVVQFNPSRGWYCRADMIPSMHNGYLDRETLWATTPVEVVNKILEQWGLKAAVPFADPEAVRKTERERQQTAERTQQRRFAGLRPGDR